MHVEHSVAITVDGGMAADVADVDAIHFLARLSLQCTDSAGVTPASSRVFVLRRPPHGISIVMCGCLYERVVRHDNAFTLRASFCVMASLSVTR